MTELVLQPTDTAQWFALVNEAQLATSHILHEDIESYLVFMLMRFTEQPEQMQHVLAEDFFASMHAVGQMRHDKLRDLGDKCLLLSGLFPGLAQKRRVEVSYFVNMGQSAYATLAMQCNSDATVGLFATLCEEFVNLKDVLQAMRCTRSR